MSRFSKFAPALLILAGLLLGIVLTRLAAVSLSDAVLTMLALFVVGMLVGAAILLIGLNLGKRQQTPQNVSRREPLPQEMVASAPTLTSDENSIAASRNQITETPLVTSAVSLAAENTARELMLPSRAPARARLPLAIGNHFFIERQNGKLVLRLQDWGQYESLEFAVSIPRGAVAEPRVAMPRDWTARGIAKSLTRMNTLALVLFVLSLGVYAFTRLFAIDQFPINFFADEAVEVTSAVDLVQRGFRDPQGALFPMYFDVFFFKNPLISVYAHALTASLFGVSIGIARSTSAILTLFGTAAVALTLKLVFRARYWWAAVLLLAITPAWFMHSRTAFDTVAMTALYALLIFFYLLYRYRAPVYLYPALAFAAATFYAYPSGQAAVGVLVLFFLISDLRYHIQHWRTLLWGIPLVAILAIPFIRFEILHPSEAAYHLRQVNSYWTQDIPVSDKVQRFADAYGYGLSPQYWFIPNDKDLIRHRMKDYGQLPLIELPLLLIGVILCLRHFNESRYRAALVALLAAPIGAALADIGILRALAFVIPAGLVGTLGLEWLLTRVKPRFAAITALAVFTILSVMSFSLLQDALANGPTWYDNYTLYGMQWGAKQLFQDELPDYMQQHPNDTIYVTPNWANGTDIFLRFFNVNAQRVRNAPIDFFLEKQQKLDANSMMVLIPDEYAKAQASNKFKQLAVERVISYPNGANGFYFVRAAYADNVAQIFAEERQALLRPVTDTVTIDGQPAQLTHTKLDIGNPQAMFDGSVYTVARGIEANPLTLDLKFSKPRSVQSISLNSGRTDFRVMALLYANESDPPLKFEQTFKNDSKTSEDNAQYTVEMPLPNQASSIARIHFEIFDLNGGENAHIHVFEIKLR